MTVRGERKNERWVEKKKILGGKKQQKEVRVGERGRKAAGRFELEKKGKKSSGLPC